jgi:hypothetical protein
MQGDEPPPFRGIEYRSPPLVVSEGPPHPRRRRRSHFYLVALVALIAVLVAGVIGATREESPAVDSAETAVEPGPGGVRFVKRTDTGFDRYTTAATPSFRTWMREHFYRAEVWSPYFDDKTDWYPQGLLSRNLYAIYRHDATTMEEHPEWVLRDETGEPLYIPWDCAGGVCPQYAGDVGSPEFRQAWIQEARDVQARGYQGLWIDDVNLEFRVSDGTGQFRAPIDPRTGRTMTEEDWRRYVVEFVEQVRAAFPDAEILHNSIWFAAHDEPAADAHVRRQVLAADYINLERGVNDAGLTGGTGPFSLTALLEHIDDVQASGRAVVLDSFDDSEAGREYNLAAYFLITRGRDGIGLAQMTPDNWWPMFDVQLGTPEGERRTWEGVLRRDFADGLVLLNEPGAPTRTLVLDKAMRTSDGELTTTVTLGPAEGVVLRG